MNVPNTNRHPTRRTVRAALIETTPSANGLGHWTLASPILLFLGWTWVDIFTFYSPIETYLVDAILAVCIYVIGVVAPLGYLAHRVVTSLPRLFQHAGWDLQPLEHVAPAEIYTVSYRFEERQRANFTLWRGLIRAAQGWVYIEIFAIFAGAVSMVPLFFSATEFGFGR